MITTPAPKVSPAGSMARTVTNGDQPHNYDGGGAVQPIRTTAGNEANQTTAINKATLGFNTNLITSHTDQIKSLAKTISGSKSPTAITKHIGTITSHLNAIQNHVNTVKPTSTPKAPARPAYQRVAPKNAPSESDEGDMSHYDPTGGTGHRI